MECGSNEPQSALVPGAELAQSETRKRTSGTLDGKNLVFVTSLNFFWGIIDVLLKCQYRFRDQVNMRFVIRPVNFLKIY